MNILQMNCFVFLLCSILINILFIKLAKEWPQFMKEWLKIECLMGYFGTRKTLKKNMDFIFTSLTLFTIVEHMLMELYRVIDSVECSKTVGDGIRHYYVNVTFPHLFTSLVNYTLWKALIFHISNFQTTFCWTFGDTFIILLSTAFATQMKQSRTKVKVLVKSQIKAATPWRKIREEHCGLLNLCRLLDQKISYLVLVSFCSNLYFVLVQLFNALRPMSDILQKAYFFISFGFLIFRIIYVSLSAASINDESRKLLIELLLTPPELYNVEIERLINQITYKTAAISGKSFFIITRGLILKVSN
ncbi:gustatory receptor for sugar taste 64e-like [Tribolium madens]|uniref:gustatory receptor for sugar taste 64e-like n=1 Tax=Tribolium madens TaxID=41895 RepID=UPI001CF73F06|nr:gustatory receptor for sugar taste 64e-like [Tribolium madens]